MSSFTIWIIAALLLGIGEMFTAGFFLGILALGAVAAGLAAMADFPVTTQWLVFSITSLVAGISLRPIAQKYIYGPKALVETNTDALISQSAIIVESIDPETGVGRVLVAGENWRARSLNASQDAPVLVKGQRATVMAIEGATVIIQPPSKPEFPADENPAPGKLPLVSPADSAGNKPLFPPLE
jgi:membrane protein implicated in regulation of membrane protease activity